MEYESIESVTSIFEQPWWLEATAPNKWIVIEVVRNDVCVGRLPIVEERTFGVRCFGTPSGSMFSGPWIKETGGKPVTYLRYQKEVMAELIKQLPQGNIRINLSPEHQYYLPFLWNGFKFEPCFTYRINDTSDLDKVWNDFDKSARKAVSKGAESLILRTDLPIEVLFDLEDKTYARQNRKNPVDKERLRRVYESCVEHEAGVLMCAVDKEERVHTATLYVYDSKVMYAIHGGSDPELRSSQSDAFLIWKALELASEKKLSFDFEGSSIEAIEKYFRSFGGTPTVYLCAKKYGLVMSLLDYVKPIIKKILGWK